MAYNIEFAAAFQSARPESNSIKADFSVSTQEKDYSFRDRLKEAVASKSRKEDTPYDKASLRKEMISRSESGLKNLKKPVDNISEKKETKEESTEKQAENAVTGAHQMLSLLEELNNLQKQAEVPQNIQTALLENIKEALTKLDAAETKAAELTSVLEAQISRLKSGSGLSDSKFIEHLTSELKAMLGQEPVQPVATASIKADAVSKVISMEAEAESTNTVKVQNGEAELLESCGNESKTPKDSIKDNTEGSLLKEASSNKTHNTGEETDAASREARNMTEETADAVKKALDNKVEKVGASNRQHENQEKEVGKDRENSSEVIKAAGTVHYKTENADMPETRIDQAMHGVKPEEAAVHTEARQAPVSRTEVINQIVKKAEIVVTDSAHEMRMQLEPENLGKLTLKLAVEKGLITAKFVAESNEVKQIIESGFNELKDMLQEKGLVVQNFSVSVGHENKGDNFNSYEQWKKTIKVNGQSIGKSGFKGYLEGEVPTARIANPYIVHEGKFDHRA